MELSGRSQNLTERRGYHLKDSHKQNILLVEDDASIVAIVQNWLIRENHNVTAVPTAEEACRALKRNEFDLIVLDWVLPGSTGVEFCKEFRASGGSIPILMLTTKTRLEEIESGLDIGCDDYLTKPFELRELSARIRALLRRPAEFQSLLLKAGDIELDARTYTVKRNGEQVHLLPKEFVLLEFLLKHPGKVFSPETLLDNIWDSGAETSPDAIRTYIKRIRKKIDIPGQQSLITTIHGVGYKLEHPN